MNFATKKQKPAFSIHSVLAIVSARLGLQNNELETATSDLKNQKHDRFRVLAKLTHRTHEQVSRSNWWALLKIIRGFRYIPEPEFVAIHRPHHDLPIGGRRSFEITAVDPAEPRFRSVWIGFPNTAAAKIDQMWNGHSRHQSQTQPQRLETAAIQNQQLEPKFRSNKLPYKRAVGSYKLFSDWL
jgi:hypothetical protein